MGEDRRLRAKLVRKRADGGDWTIFDKEGVFRSDIQALRQAKLAKRGNSENKENNNKEDAKDLKGGNPEVITADTSQGDDSNEPSVKED